MTLFDDSVPAVPGRVALHNRHPAQVPRVEDISSRFAGLRLRLMGGASQTRRTPNRVSRPAMIRSDKWSLVLWDDLYEECSLRSAWGALGGW